MRTGSATQVLLVSAMRRDEYYAQSLRRRAVGDLGIRYLAAWLRQNGVLADVLPAHLNTAEALADRLRTSEGLCLVGFSMHTSSLASGFDSLAISRRVRPDVPIAVGGYLPTFAGQALRSRGADFDYLAPGEAESALLDLTRSLLGGYHGEGISGIVSGRAGGDSLELADQTRGAPVDLDSLPMPLRTSADVPHDTTEMMVSASRGCYGHCTFCSVPVFGSSGWRGRAPELVAEEVAILARDFHAEFIDFVDDSLFGPRDGMERATRLRDALADLRVRVPFRASIRPNDVDADRIRVLRECGLVAVQLGVESFSSRQLVDVYHKGCRPEDALRAVRVLESERVHVQTGLILFEPSTCMADLRENAAALANEPWGVAKSNTPGLFCAQGTKLAADLVARGESLGLEDCLNHSWRLAQPEVGMVREALQAFERESGDVGEALVDAITPPQTGPEAGMTEELRALQNRHQRLSFAALGVACDAVSQGASSELAVEALRCGLGDEREEIVLRARALLSPALHIEECR